LPNAEKYPRDRQLAEGEEPGSNVLHLESQASSASTNVEPEGWFWVRKAGPAGRLWPLGTAWRGALFVVSSALPNGGLDAAAGSLTFIAAGRRISPGNEPYAHPTGLGETHLFGLGT
jgi:hypothetical protein